MANDVWITGIGLLSNLGEGPDAHWQALTGGRPRPVIDRTNFAPFSVFTLPEIDFSQQIPKRSDQRQMEQWQRVGTYAAGLAISDAGLAGNLDILGNTDMIIAAGGGERDTEVDAQILENLPDPASRQPFINERLVNDLRPTLFLAQLPNLLAGNISIVHKVTGSSRTFMGEESAGVTAIDTAQRRVAAGQSAIALVGAAYVAERKDIIINHACGRLGWLDDPISVWARPDKGGGFIIGSAGVFLVLETSDHARARGARPYARLGQVQSDWPKREPGKAAAAAARELATIEGEFAGHPTALLTSASGNAISGEEHDFIAALLASGKVGAVRATANYLGSAYEADFPAGVALAALALSRKGLYAPADESGFEQASDMVPERILVNCWSHWRGTGMAVLAAVE